MGGFVPEDHVKEIDGVFVARCPMCEYVKQARMPAVAGRALTMHYRAKHKTVELVADGFEYVSDGEQVTRITSAEWPVAPEVDPRNASQRIVDAAFEVQVKELMEQRSWDELEALFLLHGRALERRYS